MGLPSFIKNIFRRKKQAIVELGNANNENFVPIEKTSDEIPVIVNQHTKTLDWQGMQLNWMFGFILAILAVCVIGYITFLRDAYNYHTEAYKENTKTIEDLKSQNQQLRDDKMNQRMDFLQKEIDELKITPTPFGKG